MTQQTSVISFDPPEINRREILHYLGCTTENSDISSCIDNAVRLSSGCFRYSAAYKVFDIAIDGNSIDLGFTSTTSSSLAKNLHGCSKIILFAATVGHGVDMLISRYERISPSTAACLQALGGERVESVCNVFNDKVKSSALEKGYITHPRFSCGYGDLSLSLQKDIIPALDAQRKLGITLTDSMLMLPTKSVTAIIGLEKAK